MAWVQYQVESYQRLKKWYLMPPRLTLSIIRYGSRVKWSNPWKEVVPSPTPRCSSYRKEGLRVPLDYARQLYLLIQVVLRERILHILTNERVLCKKRYKMGKVYLTSVNNIAMWLYHSLAVPETMSILFKEPNQKDVENGSLRPSDDTILISFGRYLFTVSLPYISTCIYPTLSPRAGCDSWSTFKRMWRRH